VTKVREVSHMLKAIHAQESREAADRKARAIVDDLRAARMNTAAYKGKPALAPLARIAGRPRSSGDLPEGGRPSDGKGFAARCSVASAPTLTFGGQTKSMTEWADELGISQSALSMRLSRGWSVERALSWRRKPKEQGPIS
jgi:hypothetical protein